MDEFKEIRPYQDNEIRPVLDALRTNGEFTRSVARFYYPRLSRFLMPVLDLLARRRLRSQVGQVNSVATMQDIIAIYMEKMIRDTSSGLTYSGLDKLKGSGSHVYISNHRDIAMDPGLMNYVLHKEGIETLQIAIGDNLLKKPFVTDLMRLNKSFIVRRSLKGRELLKALDLLSRYIHYCIANNHNVWIAQREGRAKDGIDQTDPALIKMLALGRRDLPLGESIAALKLIPVAISYEFDACDELKAEELHQVETTGTFEKTDESDIHSIVTGIVGFKGRVHLAFGEQLQIDTDDPDEIATMIDAQILANYRLHDTNFLALQLLRESSPTGLPELAEEVWNREVDQQVREKFTERFENLDESLRKPFLAMYANPVIRRYRIDQ
jgi:1-acyl-sn-glycerol-3-phosphate acyltransferase